MNKENFEILASKIEKLEHKQGVCEAFDEAANGFNLNREFFGCGAPACIAGWATSLATNSSHIKMSDIKTETMKFLGIDSETFEELCYPFDAFAGSNVEFEDILPEEAAKVIRNLAETGQVDWTIVGVESDSSEDDSDYWDEYEAEYEIE